MKYAKDMTEKELRDTGDFHPQTESELIEYVHSLVERNHDYGTCVYAMSLSATAAFNYVAHMLGVTGFQASCADMDILRRTRNMKSGFMILDYDNLLYPQYCNEEHFPDWKTLLEENKKELKKMVAQKLAEDTKGTHPSVMAHWKMIAAL